MLMAVIPAAAAAYAAERTLKNGRPAGKTYPRPARCAYCGGRRDPDARSCPGCGAPEETHG